MAETLSVELCAPERKPVNLTAKEIIIPGEGGVLAVRPGHTPLLTTLIPGVVLAYDEEGGEQFFAVNGGFAEIKDDKVTLLSATFENSEKIDLERAEAARERAEERLRKPSDDTDIARAELGIRRAIARIEAQKHKHF